MRLYVSALRSDPKAAGTSARVGIGLCAYHLGDKGKAIAAFERALILDPANVEALVAMAILRLDFASSRAQIHHAKVETVSAKFQSPNFLESVDIPAGVCFDAGSQVEM